MTDPILIARLPDGSLTLYLVTGLRKLRGKSGFPVKFLF